MKKIVKYLVFTAAFFCCVFSGCLQVQAEDKSLPLTADETKKVELYVGDTGKIVPDNTISKYIDDDWDWYSISDEDEDSWYYDNWYEDEDEDSSYDDTESGSSVSKPVTPPVRYEYTLDDNWDGDHCITLNSDGSFKAVTAGNDTVKVVGFNIDGRAVFCASVEFSVKLDMSNVTLSKTSLKGYMFPISSWGQEHYSDVNFLITINAPGEISDCLKDMVVSCESSNQSVSVYADIENGKLKLSLYADKKCSTDITVTIGEKDFKISVFLQPVKVFSNSCLLEKGHSKKLTISGYSGTIAWSSTNPKVASVSKSGVVKGKTIGNTVITAKIGEQRIGCAVSVTTASIKKVCERATYIGTHWKYSQPKRAQNGYYDCSALVWKAYTKYTKINFGSSSYPGTTATEAPWCRDHGKLMKGGFSYKKIEKMQLNPGDIVFKSDNLKKPYTTTTHVEMFTGYEWVGYDSNGKPTVEDKWAARENRYGNSFAEGSLWARPAK